MAALEVLIWGLTFWHWYLIEMGALFLALTNILVPTNAVIVGILAMAAIPFDRWLRFIFPFMVKIWVVGSIALAVAVAIGYA